MITTAGGLNRWVAEDTDKLRVMHAAGYSDPDIAAAIGCTVRSIFLHRTALGLPSNGSGPKWRSKIKAAAKARSKSENTNIHKYWDKYRNPRWPADLRPIDAAILDALWSRGPMTKREICEAIGVPWRGPQRSLHAGGKRRPCHRMAFLAEQGYVISFSVVLPWPHCRKVYYSLALDVAPLRGMGESDDAQE